MECPDPDSLLTAFQRRYEISFIIFRMVKNRFKRQIRDDHFSGCDIAMTRYFPAFSERYLLLSPNIWVLGFSMGGDDD
jgi:hypothetical protein